MSKSRDNRAKASGLHRITAVHLQGGAARLVTLTRTGDGELRLVEASSLELAAGNGESLRRALATQRPDRIIHVLPASNVIVRLVPLTLGEGDDLAELLQLQAEAQLPERLPWHRRGAALVRGADGQERALLVGWPGDDLPAAVHGVGNGKLRCCPDTAALVALRREGQAPTSLLYADRSAGSLALAAGDLLRSLRIRMSEAAADDIERAIQESAALTDTRQPGFESLLEAAASLRKSERRLFVPPDMRAAWSDAIGAAHIEDEAWWQRYGVALGAAAQAFAASPVNTLADLRVEPIVEQRSTGARLITALGAGRRPYAALFVCLLVLSLLPALHAGARLLVLRASVGDAASAREQQEALTARFALYSAVTARTWPMTKLLADLAAAMPPGIEVDSLTVANGQQVQLSGLADSLDQLVTLQENLRAGRIFEDVQLPRRHIGETGKVEFALRAEVAQPWIQAEPAFDYVAQTLQERLYGASDAGGGTTTTVRNDAPSDTPSTSSPNGSRLTDPRSAQQEEVEAPEPLTADAIAKMTTEDLRKAYTQRLVLKSRPFDEATKQRLEEEAEALRAELKQR